jgi:hypothetical protein
MWDNYIIGLSVGVVIFAILLVLPLIRLISRFRKTGGARMGMSGGLKKSLLALLVLSTFTVLLIMVWDMFSSSIMDPNRTTVVAEEQTPVTRGAVGQQREIQAEATPTTVASLWADLNRWLARQGLPDAITLLIILVAVATVLYGIYAVATNGADKWPARIGGTTLALALAYGGAIGLIGKERTDAYLAYASQSIPAPGSPAEGGAGGRTSAPVQTASISVGAERVRHTWRAGEPVMVATDHPFCVRINLYTDSHAKLQRHLGGTDPRTLITEHSGTFSQKPRLAQAVTDHFNGNLPVEFQRVDCPR